MLHIAQRDSFRSKTHILKNIDKLIAGDLDAVRDNGKIIPKYLFQIL